MLAVTNPKPGGWITRQSAADEGSTDRAEINEEAWASLYSTVSRRFPKPETSRIAVKVINHYGDEVLKVYGIG